MEPRLGCHTSIAGGLFKAPGRAKDINCTAFQIFTRNPRGWAYNDLNDDEISSFHESVGDDIYPVAHMPYLPNLAAPDPEKHQRSVDGLTVELERCEQLGIEYLVTHLGSHVGTGEEGGRKRIVEAIEAALGRAKSKTMILMENTAGTKNSLGTTPEELAIILDALDGNKRVGICVDTAHAFAAGYDWNDPECGFVPALRKEKLLERVKVLHFNDSKVACGKRADRHDHLGLGEIGLGGLKNVLSEEHFRTLPIILETPIDEVRSDRENIEIAWKLLKHG